MKLSFASERVAKVLMAELVLNPDNKAETTPNYLS